MSPPILKGAGDEKTEKIVETGAEEAASLESDSRTPAAPGDARRP
jgi:hypothetical protein